MQPKARFTLIREQSMGATSAVFESDFDSAKANDAALREQEGPGGCRIERAWMTGHPVCRECGDECDCYVCVPDTPGERAWS